MTKFRARLPLAAAAALLAFAATPGRAQNLSHEALVEALADGGYVVIMNLPQAAAPASRQGGAFGGGAVGGRGAPGGFGGRGGPGGPAAGGARAGGGGPAAGGGRGGPGGPAAQGGGRGGPGGPAAAGGGRGGGAGNAGGGLADMEDAQMIAVSFAFRELKIPVGTFYMGGDARSTEAARLFYFGDQQTVRELDGGGQASFVTAKVGETPPEGKNTVVLAPQASIAGAFGTAANLQAFETLIFEAGSTMPVARLTPKDWATLALE